MRSRYREIEVETSSPERIVAKLYVEALRQMDIAVAAVELGDAERKAQSLDRALRIIGELRSALDLQRGGEIAKNLDALYEFVGQQLLEGSARGAAEPIRDAQGVVTTLSEAWTELADRREAAGG